MHNRIKEIRERLYNGSNAQFAEFMNEKPNTTSNWVSGSRKIGVDVVEKLKEKIPNLNLDWLFTGEGNMLKEEKENSNIEIETIHHPKSPDTLFDQETINLYDIEAAANLDHLFTNKDQHILGKITIPDIPLCDGAIYVRGDSMYPLLKSGDIIAYKIIPNDIRNIIYGEMYLVSIDMAGDEYLAVKYINHSDEGEEWIKLVSYNTHHQPKDFPLSSVRAMALVKFSIRMNTMK